MHFSGMAGMVMPRVRISWDIPLLILAMTIAYVASAAALWVSVNVRSMVQKLISALIMGVAVCGMHYSGMYAWVYEEDGSATRHSSPFQMEFDESQIVLLIILMTSGTCFAVIATISNMAEARRRKLATQQRVLRGMLLNVLPAPTALRALRGEENVVEVYPNCTNIFVDVVNYATLSAQNSVAVMVNTLHTIYSAFDLCLDMYGIERLKPLAIRTLH